MLKFFLKKIDLDPVSWNGMVGSGFSFYAAVVIGSERL